MNTVFQRFLVGTVIAASIIATPFFAAAQTSSLSPLSLIVKTNKERVNVGAGALSYNPTLEKAAQMKADDMAKNGYFAHVSPAGLKPWHWFREAGYAYVYAGENLAVNFNTEDALMSAWMSSPTHRANMVNTHYTEIGIATARGYYNGQEVTFVVQMFGSPKSAAAEIRTKEADKKLSLK